MVGLAAIREIEARTDSTYIQAGVVAPDEVRTKIREDELSGFSSLDETMPDDGQDLFGDEEGAEGNGTTQQDPFQ